MQLKSLNVYFFFLLLFGVGVVVFFIFQPFLTAIVAAAILAVLFQGVYRTFKKWFHGHQVLCALFTCLLVIIIIVTPLFLILGLAIGEANTLYHALAEQSALEVFLGRWEAVIHNTPYLNILFGNNTFDQSYILDSLKQLSQNALGLLQAAYLGVSSFVFWVFIMFFTLFYFLMDGRRGMNYIMRLSPLRNDHDKMLMEKFVSISRATLKSTLLLGALQGFLGGIMFWVVGVPSPAILGLVMVLFSIIPVFGSGIVWVPVGIIMLLMGNIWQGVFILGVGSGVISVLDNILRPKLVGNDTQMHPLLVLFATLGGLALFGLVGFVIGPIIVSLFMALSEIYSIEFRSQLKEYNE